jgi:hypothetical protein
MFDPAWVCEHHVILSVILVILTLVGILAAVAIISIGAGLIYGMVGIPIKEVLDKKIEILHKEIPKKPLKIGSFLAYILLGTVLYFTLPESGFLFFIYMSLVLTFGLLCSWAISKVFDEKANKIVRIISALIVAPIYLGVAYMGLAVLYKWWILHLCGV